jgi:hypothetical protein
MALIDLPPEVATEILDWLPLSSWLSFAWTCTYMAKVVNNHVPCCARKLGLCPEKTSLTTLLALDKLYGPVVTQRTWRAPDRHRLIARIIQNNPLLGLNILEALQPAPNELLSFSLHVMWCGFIQVTQYWATHLADIDEEWTRIFMTKLVCHGYGASVEYIWDKISADAMSSDFKASLLYAAVDSDNAGVLRVLVDKGCPTTKVLALTQKLAVRLNICRANESSQRDRLDMFIHFVQQLDSLQGLGWSQAYGAQFTRRALKTCAAQHHDRGRQFFQATFVPFFPESVHDLPPHYMQ